MHEQGNIRRHALCLATIDIQTQQKDHRIGIFRAQCENYLPGNPEVSIKTKWH